MAAGVVVEEVPESSAPRKAGIQSGDILLAWKRLPNPPVHPVSAEGEFHSPFDVHEFRLEQVPRGTVEISGAREGVEKTWRIEPGNWQDVEVRPGWIGNRLELYRLGQKEIEEEKFEEGSTAWQELVDQLGRENEDLQRLWMLFELAKLWLGAGHEQPLAAEQSLRIQELLEAPTTHRMESAYIQQELGFAFEQSGDPIRAQDLYSRALQIRQQLAPQSLAVANCLDDLGGLGWNRGNLDQAHRFFDRALRIREQLVPMSLDVARSLGNLGALVGDRGDLDQAQEFFNRALRIEGRLAPGSLAESNSLYNLGFLSWNRGDLEQAQKYYRHALRIQEQLAPGSLVVADSLNNLGLLAVDRGNLEEAWGFYMSALRIREELAPESLDVARSLGNLGIVAWHRGDLDQAKELFDRTLQINEKLAPGSLAAATSLNSLGAVAAYIGDLDQAQTLHTRALQIRKNAAPGSLAVADSLANLGAVAWYGGDLKQAQVFYARALRIREKVAPGSLAVATNLGNLGDVAIDHGDLEQAQELLTRALQLREQLAPESLGTANSLRSLASVKRARKDLNGAAVTYLQALEVLEQQISILGGSYTLQAGFRAEQRELYLEAFELLLAQARPTEAFHVLERFRARTFLTMLAERDIVFRADLTEELDRERRRLAVRHDRALKRLAGLSANKDVKQVAAIRIELKAMGRERGELEERILRASPRLAALQYPQPLTAVKAQEALDPGTLLVSYVVGEESTSIFALSQEETLKSRTIPVGEAGLRSKIDQLRELITEAVPDTELGLERTQSFQVLSRELYELLLEPVAERVDRSQRLLILPDGPLHALPFAALIRKDPDGDGDDKNDQYLVERKPIHIALSVTAYAELKKARPSVHEPGTVPMLVAAFGDPSYPESFTLPTAQARAAPLLQDAVLRSVAQRDGLDFDWQPLPHSRREVEGIADLFPKGQTQVFLGPKALEERVKNLDPGVRILHLAAHAVTDDRLPLSSFVALTIPEDLPEGRDNGLLQAWEILEQVRIDADLVVLSGCLTGMGQELRGEGLIGLTRAFQYAGARSLMSTLWSVSDQATAELMLRFYRHLRSGLPKDQALRAAQLEMLRKPIVSVGENGQPQELEHADAPFYWAGVQLYGDWQ